MKTVYTEKIEKSPRIAALIGHLFEKMPEIEADRAVLLTYNFTQSKSVCAYFGKITYYYSSVRAYSR